MTDSTTRTVRVIGVGNLDRGDDAIGPTVAAEVAMQVVPQVEVTASTAEPTRLIDAWGPNDFVVLVDAIVGDDPPGTVSVFDATAEPLPADYGSVSSHGFGVAAAVELARSLGRLPEQLVVVGVVGRVFEGEALTPAVAAAVDPAVEHVVEVVAHA